MPSHLPSTPQSHLQTQLMMLKIEMEEAKAQGTQMGAENGALTGVLGRKGAAGQG